MGDILKKVLILFGGNSYEHDISCRSVNFIIKNIDKKLFDYQLVGIDKDNIWYIVNKDNVVDNSWKKNIIIKVDNIIEYCKGFDIVFPMIHGDTSEDGKLQSLFELYDISYIGSNSYSSLISYDKYLTKLVLDKFVPQVSYIKYNSLSDLDNIEYPVIVKPSKCGSSIGINVANNRDELLKFIIVAKKYDDNIIIEKYIKNRRELECAVLEKNNELIISDVGEISIKGWYDYNSKYKNNTKTFISNISDSIKCQIRKYSKEIFRILDCKDYSRIDFLYDLDNNILYFNEINTIPGFTEVSMYPILIKNTGIDYKELITILLSN